MTKGQQTDQFFLIPRKFLLSLLRARGLGNTGILSKKLFSVIVLYICKKMDIGSDIPVFLITSQ